MHVGLARSSVTGSNDSSSAPNFKHQRWLAAHRGGFEVLALPFDEAEPHNAQFPPSIPVQMQNTTEQPPGPLVTHISVSHASVYRNTPTQSA